MGKMLLDVFPGLKIAERFRELLRLVEVERVSTPRDKSSIRVYIAGPRLIHKQQIVGLERGIKEQLFPNKKVSVRIFERYQLLGQYTPEKLLQVYKDSPLYELKNYSVIEYNIFREAEFAFPKDSVVEISIEDSEMMWKKTEELKRMVEKIFHERCGLPVEITYRYMAESENKQCKMRKVQIQKELEEKLRHSRIFAGEAGNRAMAASGEGFAAGAGEESAPWAAGAGAAGNGAGGQGSANGAATGDQGAVLRTSGKGKSGDSGGSGGKWESKKGFQKDQKYSYKKKSDNPDVLYGRDFEDEFVDINSITGEMGEITIRGKVIARDSRLLGSGKTIVIYDMTDFMDTITVKMLAKDEQLDNINAAVQIGTFLELEGMTTIDKFDGELTIGSVVGPKKREDFTGKRSDNGLNKRVGLHCHMKMSDMDGVSDAKDIVEWAKKWGMPALAIADHGCVRAFTDASHVVDKDDEFKIIYGVEGYLIDDVKQLVDNSHNQNFDDAYVVFDTETTGFSPLNNRIIEIGAVKVERGVITDKFSGFVNPDVPTPFRIEQLTGINDNMVSTAPKIDKVLLEFLAFCEGASLVAHNASFDVSFIACNAELLGLEFELTVLNTVTLARLLLPQLNRYKLDTAARAPGISLKNHHWAVDDVGATAEIFVSFLKMLKERDLGTLGELNELSALDADGIKKLPTYHIIVLAKNNVGRVNPYRLVSMSHLDYYARRPRIPKSMLNKYREGLIVGSACEAGELFQALPRGGTNAEINKIVNFYDYLEIQPLGNSKFMLRDEKSTAGSRQDLIDLNKRVVELGEQLHKPACATCDVHFLDPEDEVYRRIIMAGKGFKDSNDQAPLYLRTAEEMLTEFQYLGAGKAEEVVVINTRRIADQCERISPVRPDRYPPVIPDFGITLRNICYNRTHELYGEELPEIVVERLERELNSTISNGFAVACIIAQKLAWKSNEDGYLVGSRGSVGSFFMATMSGITEVNPLSPHYYCAKCHYSDFDSEDVKKFSGMPGCDIPDKLCPVCGEPLMKDGHDIPFETFPGFKGDREPDIGLNFSGEYQSKAHDYTEAVFGKGRTYRAGTIGTLADKTAYGYVKNYYEERGDRKRNCEINRIVQDCVGVRRTTGQHPGGIIILPHGQDINSSTPIQHPANDMTTSTVTTHFDYHSIDHSLLKLDILGHDDPTMIRMLQDLIGFDPVKDIPLDCKEAISLFQNTSALKTSPPGIGGCELGALEIPEFDTDFAVQMLTDAQPKYFSDLVCISGLSHDTDVWLGNIKDLILSGQATIQTAICCRNDIMVYLIQKGLEEGLAFTIMESARKGRGLKPKWIEEMLSHDVPEWYIESCKKIKYTFPKAHVAAYVMMTWRIAYCKVFHPLAYYAAFFSIRASGSSYELMRQGRDKLEYYLTDYKKHQGTLSRKEQDTLRNMRTVQEMYARGFDFVPIDLSKAKARHFRVVGEKLIPSLNSIDGLGEKAADMIVGVVTDGSFLSREDFRNRTKVSKTICDLMGDMGILGSLLESNQLSLFNL